MAADFSTLESADAARHPVPQPRARSVAHRGLQRRDLRLRNIAARGLARSAENVRADAGDAARIPAVRDLFLALRRHLVRAPSLLQAVRAAGQNDDVPEHAAAVRDPLLRLSAEIRLYPFHQWPPRRAHRTASRRADVSLHDLRHRTDVGVLDTRG